MASNVEKMSRGGKRCVAGGPNLISCGNGQYTEGVSVHLFPDKEKDKARHTKWVQFVRRYRPGWSAAKTSILCGSHFEESYFTMRRDLALQLGMKTYLKPDAVPTVYAANQAPKATEEISDRDRRQIIRSVITPSTSAEATTHIEDDLELASVSNLEGHTEVRSDECEHCESYKAKIIQLQKKVSKLKKKRAELYAEIEQLTNNDDLPEDMDASGLSGYIMDSDSEDMGLDEIHVSQDLSQENEDDEDWATLEDSADSTDSEDDGNQFVSRNLVSVRPGTRVAEEPKFVVFYGMLMAIFRMFCFRCKAENPSVEVHRIGTMATVVQKCRQCGRQFQWKSQPSLFGKYPAGNVMMSFGILTSGVRISQVLLMFRHMGLSAISARTFFYHQKKFLFPSVLHHWESYRSMLLEKLKGIKDAQWSGDGRFDSMGHNAKYGVYTLFSNSISKLVHFELLQANESGSSNAMELDGAKRSFQFIKDAGLKISTFISDRHKGIAKWIRESQPETSHFNDLWHVCKSLTKKILKGSKEKGFEVLKFWLKGIRKHLYWCALSTKQGFGELIVAKWKSLMRHIANKHDEHPDQLYNECAHGELEERDWIKIGTPAYDKLLKILCNTTTIKDVHNLSCDAQTSCLEGFHSTLNHWHPKMVHFSWLGTYCRHVLAMSHFNENLNREARTALDGSVCYSIVYPKFKLGEEVVREVAILPTYVYVDRIRDVLFSTPFEELGSILERYNKKVPEPLTAQFPHRRQKKDAISEYILKQSTTTPKYPPENEQECLQQGLIEQAVLATMTRKRKTERRCKKCGKPTKGHKRGKCD